MDSKDIHHVLGRLEGKLDGIEKTQTDHGKKLDVIDKRVNANEIKAARNGAVSGTLMGGFVVLLKETLHLG